MKSLNNYRLCNPKWRETEVRVVYQQHQKGGDTVLKVNSQPACFCNKDIEIVITAIITLPNKICKGDHPIIQELSLEEAMRLQRDLTKAIREVKAAM